MRRAALLVAALLTLAACGGGVAESVAAPSALTLPSTSSSAEATEAPEPTGPVLNDRGNIVKQLGEDGGLTGPDGSDLVTFAVDAITPGVVCTEQFATAPENGNLVAMDWRVSTAPGLSSTDNYVYISNGDFQFIGSDGLTVSSLDTIATYSCLAEGDLLPSSDLAPASQYAGVVLLDVPEASGTIVWRPGYAQGGWEWSF